MHEWRTALQAAQEKNMNNKSMKKRKNYLHAKMQKKEDNHLQI